MEIATAEYKNHPSINAITEKMKKRANPTFGFNFTLYEETLKEINNLKTILLVHNILDIKDFI